MCPDTAVQYKCTSLPAMLLEWYKCTSQILTTFAGICQQVYILKRQWQYKCTSPRQYHKKCLVSIGFTVQYKYLLANGIGGIPNWRGRIYPHKQFCQNLRPPYFFHILLRCCLCNSVFTWAKVFSGQRLNFSAILNLLYHLLFFNLCHACCIVMVVQYVGAIVQQQGGNIQYERVPRRKREFYVPL